MLFTIHKTGGNRSTYSQQRWHTPSLDGDMPKKIRNDIFVPRGEKGLTAPFVFIQQTRIIPQSIALKPSS